MRYRRLTDIELTGDERVAAVWPTAVVEQLAAADPGEADEPAAQFAPTAAMADVPSAVGGMVVGSYAALILVFFGLFANSALAAFAITICAFFVAMFFAVPKLFLAVEAAPERRPTLARFMQGGIATLTGRTGGGDALIQMLIVPVLLTLGLAAIGIIGKIHIG